MFVYGASLATAGNLTTNGTANTETETFFLKPGSTRPTYISQMMIAGKNGGQTQLNAIGMRLIRWGTASTAGTALAIVPRDVGAQAAVTTGSSRPTSGTTRTNVGPVLICGACSPNVWTPVTVDNMPSLPAGNAGSISGMDHASLASLLFEFALEIQEW